MKHVVNRGKSFEKLYPLSLYINYINIILPSKLCATSSHNLSFTLRPLSASGSLKFHNGGLRRISSMSFSSRSCFASSGDVLALSLVTLLAIGVITTCSVPSGNSVLRTIFPLPEKQYTYINTNILIKIFFLIYVINSNTEYSPSCG